MVNVAMDQRLAAEWPAEYESARVRETTCMTCRALDDCPLSTRGWTASYDAEDSTAIGYDVWRWTPCIHTLMRRVDAVLGERFAQRWLSTYDPRRNGEALERCWHYVRTYPPKGDRRGLLLVGPPGTGKTHLAAGVLREVVRAGHHLDFAWVHVPSRQEELAAWERTEFLAVDDLTGSAWSPQQQRLLYRLVNARYEGNRPTIVTANMAREQMERLLGRDLVDRLVEMCEVVQLSGPSWRREPRAQGGEA